MSSLSHGARLGLARMNSRSVLALSAGALCAVFLGSLLERRAATLIATDRALAGIALGIVLPVFAYGVWTATTGSRSLRDAVWVHARHGGSRRQLGTGLMLVNTAIAAAFGALLAAVAVVVTRFPADPELARDLLTSSWIGALGGACYSLLFALGSSFGGGGGARLALLAGDWLLGAGTGALALPWPRAHIRNLLGGSPAAMLPQFGATLMLLALALFFTLWTLRRTDP